MPSHSPSLSYRCQRPLSFLTGAPGSSPRLGWHSRPSCSEASPMVSHTHSSTRHCPAAIPCLRPPLCAGIGAGAHPYSSPMPPACTLNTTRALPALTESVPLAAVAHAIPEPTRATDMWAKILPWNRESGTSAAQMKSSGDSPDLSLLSPAFLLVQPRTYLPAWLPTSTCKNDKCWPSCGKMGTFTHCSWDLDHGSRNGHGAPGPTQAYTHDN